MDGEYTVYGMPGCGYCRMAVTLLEDSQLPFTYHDVMEDTEQRAILMEKVPTVKTLPQIMLAGTHIGGYTELKQSLQEHNPVI